MAVTLKRDIVQMSVTAALQCRLTKATRFFMPIPCGELRPQGKQASARHPAVDSACLLQYASRFPSTAQHSLTHDSAHLHHTTHSLATTTTTATTPHYLFTIPEGAIPTSIISAAVQSGQRLQSKSRACTTTLTAGRVYSDGEVVAHCFWRTAL